jgi:hypothetical protein
MDEKLRYALVMYYRLLVSLVIGLDVSAAVKNLLAEPTGPSTKLALAQRPGISVPSLRGHASGQPGAARHFCQARRSISLLAEKGKANRESTSGIVLSPCPDAVEGSCWKQDGLL